MSKINIIASSNPETLELKTNQNQAYTDLSLVKYQNFSFDALGRVPDSLKVMEWVECWIV